MLGGQRPCSGTIGLARTGCRRFSRHPKVVERMEQALDQERAVVTKESLAEWLQQMKQNLDAMDPILLTSPGHVFNADESGFSVCPKAKKSAAGQEPSMFTPSQTAHCSR